MARLLIYATAVFFVFYGVAFSLLPIDMAVLVTGSSPDTPSGLIDLRATYGGLSIAVGVLLLMLGAHPKFGLLATSIVLLSMAASRLLGMALDGTPNAIMYVYLAAELVVGGVALYLRAGLDDSS